MFPHIVLFKVTIMRRLISLFPHIVHTEIDTFTYLLAMLTRFMIVENNVTPHSVLPQVLLTGLEISNIFSLLRVAIFAC